MRKEDEVTKLINMICQVYYILIYGTVPSAYSLTVYTDEQDQTFLEPNVPNIGYIAKGELVNYFVFVTGPSI